MSAEPGKPAEQIQQVRSISFRSPAFEEAGLIVFCQVAYDLPYLLERLSRHVIELGSVACQEVVPQLPIPNFCMVVHAQQDDVVL